MNKILYWSHWIKQRPIAIINIIGIAIIVFGAGGYFFFQSVREINVLDNWSVSISNASEYEVLNGVRYPVFHPSDALSFTTQWTKLTDATGNSSRIIVCQPTATEKLREIQVNTLTVNGESGYKPSIEKSIVVPDVSKFQELPRTCSIVIDITYENVHNTGRNHNEHVESELFIVKERVLDAKALTDEINNLKNQLDALSAQLDELQTQQAPTVYITPEQACNGNNAKVDTPDKANCK